METKFICVSVNPAIDKRMCLDGKLLRGKVNRATGVKGNPGGKAAHVAMVLKALGAEPAWIGLCGGASGKELVDGIARLGIRTIPVATRQPTRVNLEIIDEERIVTEVLEPGAAPTTEELQTFVCACEKLFAEDGPSTIVVLSGSLPPGLPDDFYAQLIQTARANQCRVFLDSSGTALREGLSAHPHFVKPNREETERLTGLVISDSSVAAQAVRELLDQGAESAAISLGDQGLAWCSRDSKSILFAHSSKVSVRSTVGCGDATVAGFAFAAGSELQPEESLRLAAACGAANCLADAPGRVDATVIRDLQKEVVLEVIS